MPSLSRIELQALAVRSDELRVTIYLPLKQQQPLADENTARLRDLLADAECQLGLQGLTPEESREFLQPAWKPAQFANPTGGRRGASLALLASRGCVRTELLPFACTPVVEVGRTWYLAPLLRMLIWPAEFHLLTLSEDRVSLYRGSWEGLEQVDLPIFVPRNLDDCLSRAGAGTMLPFRSEIAVGGGCLKTDESCRESTDRDRLNDRRHGFVHAVARGIEKCVVHDPLPLVLAANNLLHPVFRDAYRGAGLTEPGICGSPDALTPTELHEQAVSLVYAEYERELQSTRDRFRQIAETAEVSLRLEEILPAACQGRVNSIIAAFGRRMWGTRDPKNKVAVVLGGSSARQPGESDLLDLALQETLRHGGDVRVVPPEYVPAGGDVAAVLRW